MASDDRFGDLDFARILASVAVSANVDDARKSLERARALQLRSQAAWDRAKGSGGGAAEMLGPARAEEFSLCSALSRLATRMADEIKRVQAFADQTEAELDRVEAELDRRERPAAYRSRLDDLYPERGVPLAYQRAYAGHLQDERVAAQHDYWQKRAEQAGRDAVHGLGPL